MPETVIRPARIPEDLDTVRALFLEYARSLDFDLCFQDFDAELAGLPGKYAAPGGRLLLAWDGPDRGSALGCVALRPLGEPGRGDCEMKRLFLRPAARGTGLGRRLAERICAEGRAAGYARICLDTVPSLAPAIALYTAMGFQPIEPYVYNPIPGTLYLGLAL